MIAPVVSSLSHTGTTISPSIGTMVCVLFVVGMTLWAVGAGASSLGSADVYKPSIHVHGWSNGFKMAWVHATRISAKVVEYKPIWYLSNIVFVGKAMGKHFSMPDLNPTVAKFVAEFFPLPATSIGNFVRRQETLCNTIFNLFEVFSKGAWDHFLLTPFGFFACFGVGGNSIDNFLLSAKTLIAKRIAAESVSKPYIPLMAEMDKSSIVSNQIVLRFMATV